MSVRVAILDMYDKTPNQGMRAIKEILDNEEAVSSVDVFDVRAENEIPDLSYDLYISTGGPGDPRVGDGIWDKRYYAFLDEIVMYNKYNEDKKYLFLICHSFQMACHHFGVGKVTERDTMSFGTFPIDKSNAGLHEPLLAKLPNPFCVADFRSYQVIEPDHDDLAEKGYRILALEDHRQFRAMHRAIMGVRFSAEIIGFQFHPEADSKGMVLHFEDDARRKHIITEYGQERYDSMIEDLKDPEKITLTHGQIIPGFIRSATGLKCEQVLV